jgi:hypothetical protein
VSEPFFCSCLCATRLTMENSDPDDEQSRTRKLVKSNNFTVQTNALDVDKHMCVVGNPSNRTPQN